MPNQPHARYEPWYAALRSRDPALWRRCIEAGEGVSLKYNLRSEIAADVEIAIVMMACEAAGIDPKLSA